MIHQQQKNSNLNDNLTSLLLQYIDFISHYKYQILHSLEEIIIQVQHEIEEIQKNNPKSKEQLIQYLSNQLNEFEQQYNNLAIKYLIWKEKQIEQKYEGVNIQPLIYLNVQDTCRSFDFISNRNILLVCSKNQLVVYKIKQDEMLLDEIDRKSIDYSKLISIHCMKESNLILTASQTNILIWEIDQNIKLKFLYKFLQEKEEINCFLINKAENILVFCSRNKNIQFWKRKEYFWVQNQIIQTNQILSDLSLDKKEQNLICCGESKQIFILNQQEGNWNIVQIISVEEQGYRLCFTLEDEFVFQPQTSEFLKIYKYHHVNKEFNLLKKIQIQKCDICSQWFPCQIIESQKLLIIKHGNFLNIFRFSEDSNYKLVETIDFQHHLLYGSVSRDERYLVTWDSKSQQIQMRKILQHKDQ